MGNNLVCLRYIIDESPLFSKIVQECAGLIISSDLLNLESKILS